MAWVDELGEKRFSDKEIAAMSKLLVGIVELTEDTTDVEEFKEAFVEVIDTSIDNLSRLKKEIQETKSA